MNKTYKSMIEQYEIKNSSHRVHLRVDSRAMRISPAMLDKIADEKLTAGYTSKNKRCEVCYEKKSLSGDCYCTI